MMMIHSETTTDASAEITTKTTTKTTPKTTGVHHVGLTTPDLAATHRFFTQALGFAQVGEVPDYPALFVSDGSTLVTLWQVQDMSRFVPFDRHHNAGLHHVAFGVADAAALDAVYQRVSGWPDVEIECAPCPIGEGSAVRHFLFLAPGGIRIELATPFS